MQLGFRNIILVHLTIGHCIDQVKAFHVWSESLTLRSVFTLTRPIPTPRFYRVPTNASAPPADFECRPCPPGAVKCRHGLVYSADTEWGPSNEARPHT